jgi:Protein of unknown function (DUF998)
MTEIRKSRALIAYGVAICPLFYAVVVIQMLSRTGFDIRKHPLSLLSLGDVGWIQVANFIVIGVLAIACAAGLRQALRSTSGETWGPLLIATYGLGMITAGIFPPDPLPGFPPGAAQGIPQRMSGHAVMHGVGFLIAFASLIGACIVFGRRYFLIGKPGWAVYSIATGIMTPLIIIVGMAVASATGISFFVVGILAFGWVGAVSAQVLFKSADGPSHNRS